MRRSPSLLVLGILLLAVTPAPADEPPAVTITSPAPGQRMGPTGMISYSATCDCHLECNLLGTFTFCDAIGFRYTGLSDGEFDFTVRAVDTTGASGSASVHFTVDATPPLVTVLKLTKVIGGVKLVYALSDTSPISSIYMARDGNAAVLAGSGTSGSKVFTNLSKGKHTFRVYGLDEVGNTGANSTASAAPAERATISYTVL